MPRRRNLSNIWAFPSILGLATKVTQDTDSDDHAGVCAKSWPRLERPTCSISTTMAPSPRRLSLLHVCLVCLSVFCVSAFVRVLARARVCACVCAHVFCARVRAPLLARRCFCVCLFALRVCPACFFVCLFALVCRMVLRFQQRLHAQKICMQYFQPPRQSAIV